jgi:pyrimidine-specific ribonucleoside hydrolase
MHSDNQYYRNMSDDNHMVGLPDFFLETFQIKIERMKKLLLLQILLLVVISSIAQSQLPRTSHSIIIDTDGAIDDMRAISYLLSRPEIIIKAVLISDGSVTPEEGAKKTLALIKAFDHDDIPVMTGTVNNGVNPPWRQFNNQVSWGKEEGKYPVSYPVADRFAKLLDDSGERLILVCLGPLTNVASALSSNPEISVKIEKIIWYNESANPPKGFNYECDKESADYIIKSGVRIDVISNLGKQNALFDHHLYDSSCSSKTKLAANICFVHSQKPVQKKLLQNHFRLADDLVSIYLINPELFIMNTLPDNPNIRQNSDYNPGEIKRVISDMIAGRI